MASAFSFAARIMHSDRDSRGSRPDYEKWLGEAKQKFAARDSVVRTAANLDR